MTTVRQTGKCLADSFDTINYEVDGHTATITLNRPDALNALSPHMITELRAAYDEAENDDNVWLLIVTGTGRAFCTGADVKAIPGDGKVIYERPYLSTLRTVGGAAGRHPAVSPNGQAGADRGQRIVLWRRPRLGHHFATSSSHPTMRHSSIRTSASDWWPDASWCGWPGCCPDRSPCGWR